MASLEYWKCQVDEYRGRNILLLEANKKERELADKLAAFIKSEHRAMGQCINEDCDYRGILKVYKKARKR